MRKRGQVVKGETKDVESGSPMPVNGSAGNSSCLVKVANIVAELHDAERRAAQLIYSNPAEVIHCSITELAERSSTSEATIVRLCKRLGYKGFQELKIRLAQDVVAPSYQMYEAIEKDDDSVTIKKKVFDSHIRALDDTSKVLDDDAFVRAVQALASARCVEFYGTGGSGAIALDARHKFLKIGIKSFASPDSTLQAMSASLLRAGDVVVGISHSGGNKEVIEALALARRAGATVIAITNYGKSPIRRVSDIVLFTASKETAFKSDAVASRIAELAIIDALCAAVAFSRYEQSFENLKKTREATVSRKY